MEHSRCIKECKPYYLTRITKEDEEIINSFSCRQNGGYLEGYLKECALEDENNSVARTYLVKDMATDELVAYFSLKAGFVSVNEDRGLFESRFDTIPAVELANFAVNANYISTHMTAKGVGKVVFKDFILWIIEKAAEWVGIDFVYIFALPNEKLIKRYRQYGFTRLSSLQERAIHKRIRPRYDENCIFMYRQL